MKQAEVIEKLKAGSWLILSIFPPSSPRYTLDNATVDARTVRALKTMGFIRIDLEKQEHPALTYYRWADRPPTPPAAEQRKEEENELNQDSK